MDVYLSDLASVVDRKDVERMLATEKAGKGRLDKALAENRKVSEVKVAIHLEVNCVSRSSKFHVYERIESIGGGT